MARHRNSRGGRSQAFLIPEDVDAATDRAAEADIPDADLEGIDSGEPRPRTLEYFAAELTNDPDVDDIGLYVSQACEIRQKIRTALSECKASNDEEGIAHYKREEGHLLRKVLLVDAQEVRGRRSHEVLEYLTNRVNAGENLEPLEMEFFAELHANTVVDGEWEASRHELIMQQKHGRTGGMLGWRSAMHSVRKFMAGDYRAATVTTAGGYERTTGQGLEAASRFLGKNKWWLKAAGGLGILVGGPAGWTIGAGMLARGAVEAVKRAGFTERKDKETGFSLNEAVTEGEIAIAGLVKALSEEVMHAEDPDAKNKAIEALVEAELCASGNNFELHIYRVGNQTVMRASLPGKPPVIAPPPNSEEVFSQITLETTDYTDGTKRKVKTRGVATFDGVLGRSIKTERVAGAVETLASLAAGGIAGSQAVLRGMHEAVQQGYGVGDLAQSADIAHPSFRAMESVGDVKGLARSLLSAKEWLLNIQHDPASMADFHRVAENVGSLNNWDFIHAAQEAGAGTAHMLDVGSATVAAETIDSIGAFLNSMKALVALSGVQMLNRAGIDAPHDALKSEFEEIDELYRRVKAQSERIKVPPAKPNGSSGNSSASSPSAPKSGEGGSDSGGGGSESGPHVMTEREKKIRAKIAEEARLDVEQLPKVGEENWFALNANGTPNFTKQCHITKIVWGPTADTATILFDETTTDTDGNNYTKEVQLTLVEFLTFYRKAKMVPKTFEESNPAARPVAKPAEAAAPVAPAAPAPPEARPAAEPKQARTERPPRPNLAESDDGGLESNGHKEKYDTDEEATTEIQKLNRLLRDEREVDSNCQMPTLKLFVKVNGRNAIFTPKYDFNGMLYNIDMTKPDQEVVTANNGTERQVKLENFLVKQHGNKPGYYIYARVSLVKGGRSTNEQGTGQEDNIRPIKEDEETLDDEGI